MIVGNGLIANAFREVDREDVVFFASGVSNSLETDKNQFLREENLIRKILSENPEKLFVYFSTCSIYDSSKSGSAYVNHKLNMEHLVATESNQYLIARVSNAVGKGGNPNLLMNYVFGSIKKGETICIHKNATRNLIDVEDVRNIVLKLIREKRTNQIVNVAYLCNFRIEEVVKAFERKSDRDVKKMILDLGETYSIDVSEIREYFTGSTEEYLSNLIKKYYS